jgi:hypothetical protein
MPTTRRHAIAAALAAAFPSISVADPAELRSLAPSQSATGDPEFLAFIDRIKAISARKDARSLLALMGPVFRVDFDFGKGPASFSRRWRPQSPSSEVWPVLDRLLALPGYRYDPTLYVVPYVYGKFPIDLDPLAHVAATADSVAVRELADANAKEIATLGRQIVPTVENYQVPVRLDKEEWIKVAPSPDTAGFVRASDVYSPAGYRAFFEKKAGRWRWISLVCAD